VRWMRGPYGVCPLCAHVNQLRERLAICKLDKVKALALSGVLLAVSALVEQMMDAAMLS